MIVLSTIFPSVSSQLNQMLQHLRAQEQKQAACKWDSGFQMLLLHIGLVKAQLSASAVFTLLGHPA